MKLRSTLTIGATAAVLIAGIALANQPTVLNPQRSATVEPSPQATTTPSDQAAPNEPSPSASPAPVTKPGSTLVLTPESSPAPSSAPAVASSPEATPVPVTLVRHTMRQVDGSFPVGLHVWEHEFFQENEWSDGTTTETFLGYGSGPGVIAGIE